jgi:hypothetical protein
MYLICNQKIFPFSLLSLSDLLILLGGAVRTYLDAKEKVNERSEENNFTNDSFEFDFIPFQPTYTPTYNSTTSQSHELFNTRFITRIRQQS